MAKSAFVAIVGRPSAGKSTLVNALCGGKVSIVSPVPQTTRNSVRGIVNKPEGQLVLVDTPGFHISDKRLNKKLRDVAVVAFSDADVILYLVDATRKPGAEEDALAAALAPVCNKVIPVVNKTDSIASNAEAGIEYLTRHFPGAKVMSISALKETGLDELLVEIFSRAEEGPAWYPAEYYTDQEPVFRIAEIIREKIMLHTRDELPHAVFVDYQDSTRQDNGILNAEYDLVVERDSQKGIIIGKAGSMIKKIREESEADLNEIFDYTVKLKLQVRVDPDWKKDEKRLDKLIF
ncbi:MAG: GTPase Era [Rectinemataceae bacterium]|nr:GTPase Era [Rectinemataceae bacterium]